MFRLFIVLHQDMYMIYLCVVNVVYQSFTLNCKKMLIFQIVSFSNWLNVYISLYKTTLGTKMREFQYKAINNILTVNKKLYNWKIKVGVIFVICIHTLWNIYLCNV